VPGAHRRTGGARIRSRIARVELSGWLRGVATPVRAAAGRVGTDAVGGRAATSSAARRTTGAGRMPTSPTTRRDGRRCGEKSYPSNTRRTELAGVATPGVNYRSRVPFRLHPLGDGNRLERPAHACSVRSIQVAENRTISSRANVQWLSYRICCVGTCS